MHVPNGNIHQGMVSCIGQGFQYTMIALVALLAVQNVHFPFPILWISSLIDRLVVDGSLLYDELITSSFNAVPRYVGHNELPEYVNVWRGWSGGAMVLGKLPVPGRPTIWIIVGKGPTALVVGAGGGCLNILLSPFLFSPLFPSLWETARYRLKYCLKGPLSPNTTNQPNQCLAAKLPGSNTYRHFLWHRWSSWKCSIPYCQSSSCSRLCITGLTICTFYCSWYYN